MLFILIPIAWLAVLALLAAVCRVAASGDAECSPAGEHSREWIGDRLLLQGSAAPTVHAGRAHRATRRLQTSHPARRRRLASHSIR